MLNGLTNKQKKTLILVRRVRYKDWIKMSKKKTLKTIAQHIFKIPRNSNSIHNTVSYSKKHARAINKPLWISFG